MDMDKQVIEIIGRNYFINQALLAGIEVATPIRDRGVDLLAYVERDHERFCATPLQLKVATERDFSLYRKYEQVLDVRLVLVWRATTPTPEVYCLTYREAMGVMDVQGYSASPTWNTKNEYHCTRPGVDLLLLLKPFLLPAAQGNGAKWRERVLGVRSGAGNAPPSVAGV